MDRQINRFNSRWDRSTWLILLIILACCVGQFFLDFTIWPFIISVLVLVYVIVLFKSIYYVIDGDRLIVYDFFRPKEYPISQIREVNRTKLNLAGPATSLTHRIAVKFKDRSIMKSFLPLILSPDCEHEFVKKLREVNPDILTDIE